MSQNIAIAKAYPIGKDYPVPDTIISITGEARSCATLGAARGYYAEQAEMLEAVLNKVLPGGTYHALLVKMLERTVSLLRVPQ